MKATKGNKEYTIDESQQKAYQDGGFDIKDDDGNVIAYGRGKTVPYGDYMALKEELEALRTDRGEASEPPETEDPEREPDKEPEKGKATNQKAGK